MPRGMKNERNDSVNASGRTNRLANLIAGPHPPAFLHDSLPPDDASVELQCGLFRAWHPLA